MVQNVSHEDGFEGPGGVVGFVVLAVVAAVVWWMVGAHEPEAGAQRAFASSVDEGGWYEFGEGDVGVVVYPGAWVDAEAYALTARELSSETGAVVAVVRVPLDVAPAEGEAADEVTAAHPEVESWVKPRHKPWALSRSL